MIVPHQDECAFESLKILSCLNHQVDGTRKHSQKTPNPKPRKKPNVEKEYMTPKTPYLSESAVRGMKL